MCFANISSQSMMCLFIRLRGSFAFEQTKVFHVEDIQSLTIKCDVSCRLKKTFIRLRKFTSISIFWRILKSWVGVEFCQMLFLYLFTSSNIFLFYCIIMVDYNNWFLTFKSVLHSCTRSTWSWCIILVLYIAGFYYQNFDLVSMFMSNIVWHFSFLVVLLSGFEVRVTLAS